VFEVARSVAVGCGHQSDTAGDAGNHVVVQLRELDPFPAIQLVAVKADLLFVTAQVSAVE
jgi:hypothetical protein